MDKPRRYTLEFKKQAVELAATLGCVSKAAQELGIPDVNIHAWKKTIGQSQGKSFQELKASAEQEEIKRLRKENADLKQCNLILKTAAAFFSQDHLKKSMG